MPKKNKIENKECIKVNFKEKWIGPNDLVLEKNLMNLLRFYLWETICKDTSSRGISMRERGWDSNCWKRDNNRLRNYLLNKGKLFKYISYKCVNKLSELETALNEFSFDNDFIDDLSENKIVFIKEYNMNEFESIFYYIRCAFAHGRFKILQNSQNETVYIFEGVNFSGKYKNCLKARMILKEKTLIDWMNIIEGGQKKYLENTNINNMEDELFKRIQYFIQENKAIKIDEIISNIRLEYSFRDNEIKEYLKRLKNQGILKYDRNKKCWIIDETIYNR